MEDNLRVDYFLTVEEIINHLPIIRCDDCGRVFQNASACRFHRLKQHMNLNVSATNEKRLFHRTLEEPRVITAYHCPDALCRSKKAWFDGLRNLKQHYFRAHCEKKLACDKCSFKSVLEKDMNYHVRVRCPMLEKNLAKKEENAKKPKKKVARRKRKGAEVDEETENEKVSRRRKRSASSSDEEDNESTEPNSPAVPTAPSSRTVVQPIYFIVNPENVHSVVNSIQKALVNPADITLNSISRDLPMSNSLGFMDDEPIPIIETGPGPTSTSFATQYDPQPATFCERGTMMNEEPLNFFDPPYGEEFGDLAPRPKNETFGYPGQSTSQQPQTRSFGTMFENVTTCNTGTSMIDESFDSEFLRDIETQTPSYMIQQHQQRQQPPRMNQASTTTSSDDWPWRMTDADI